MKRKIIFCCAILMTLLQFSFLNSFSLEGQVTVGDINGDGYVDSIDYANLKMYVLGLIKDFPTAEGSWAADVDGNNSIDSIDCALMKSYLLGIIKKFPKSDSLPANTSAVTPTPQITPKPIPSYSPYPDWDKEHSGYATFTGSGYSGGAALLDPIDPDMEITALNPYDYNSYGIDAALAGAYLEVTGEKGSTIVYVTDLYPEGAPGALDLCPKSFAKIDDMSKGKIDIKWRVVAAPVTGNVSYRIKEGSTTSWLAVQVRNHRYPVLKMECYINNKWVDMKKMHWNHFVVENVDSTTPRIRMTDIRGYVLEDIIDSIPVSGDTRPAYIIDGNVQFPE
ncbi:expansin EXLX1 family cellulose-binding protein [Acetivibrio clariflavus]|uniref:expansin EXLX1 family cellulose-binding protein n=1 Tax=Acetivibrio clariflavus TaxID=288965 RepID=UPI0004B5B492|nr:expansin EXLX1 family cellulose-binding protein [Acetivibrio clariflavus]